MESVRVTRCAAGFPDPYGVFHYVVQRERDRNSHTRPQLRDISISAVSHTCEGRVQRVKPYRSACAKVSFQ